MDRFWKKVNRGSRNECWLWQAGKSGRYGGIQIDGKFQRAHRIAWELINGKEIPEGLVVKHSCVEVLCCNPHHLFLSDPNNILYVADRFWAKVDRLSTNECWPWKAYKDDDGYGHFLFAGRQHNAHRIAWRLFNGIEIPSRMLVMHSCDNPGCVNPLHLKLGTELGNAHDRDMKSRQRTQHGSDHKLAKLTDKKVKEIRKRCMAGETSRSLAQYFNVSKTLIYNIVHRKAWIHI